MVCSPLAMQQKSDFLLHTCAGPHHPVAVIGLGGKSAQRQAKLPAGGGRIPQIAGNNDGDFEP